MMGEKSKSLLFPVDCGGAWLQMRHFKRKPVFIVIVFSGLTSLSTIFQLYHDGVWLRQGVSVLTFIVLPH